MQRCLVTFYGDKQDSYGIPIPMYVYLIYSTEWEMPDSGMAVVTQLTDGPSLSPPYIISLSGGIKSVEQKAIAVLERLPANMELKKLEDRSCSIG